MENNYAAFGLVGWFRIKVAKAILMRHQPGGSVSP